jgi:hypothetical protein
LTIRQTRDPKSRVFHNRYAATSQHIKRQDLTIPLEISSAETSFNGLW